METSAKFGLIGKKISYSFSKKYFEQKFQKLLLNNHSYNIIDLENLDNIKNIFETEHLKGLNVTIPYKEKIIPFIDELSDEAKEIGAINCISIENGKTKGYNTDAFGFEKTLLLHKKEHQKTAIILSKIENKSQNEIAEIMNLSTKAIESLISRGKENLSKKLMRYPKD